MSVVDEKRACWQRSRLQKKKTKINRKAWLPFIRINTDKIDFNDYEELVRVSAYIAESIEKQTKKSLIDDFSKKLLELEFKLNHSIKLKCFKLIVKKILPDYKE